MNVIKSRFVYHLMAIITVAIWGTTFVSTLKSASNLNGNLNCSKELEHYAS